jgi:hypothetical protein
VGISEELSYLWNRSGRGDLSDHLLQTTELMAAHLRAGTALPPSQVVRLRPRRSTEREVLSPVPKNPGAVSGQPDENAMLLRGHTLHIPGYGNSSSAMRAEAPDIRRRSRVIPPLEGTTEAPQIAKAQLLGHIPRMTPLRKKRSGGAVERPIMQHAKTRLAVSDQGCAHRWAYAVGAGTPVSHTDRRYRTSERCVTSRGLLSWRWLVHGRPRLL